MKCEIRFDMKLPNGFQFKREYRVEEYPSTKGKRSTIEGDQASDCECHAELNGKKFCGKCGKEQKWVTKWRRVKIGAGKGEDAFAAVEKERFDEIDELLPEAKVFIVKEIMTPDAMKDAEERIDRTMYIVPQRSSEKGVKAQQENERLNREYAELAKMLKGVSAVGAITLRKNNYEGILDSVERNGKLVVRLRLLVLPSQYNGLPELKDVEVDEKKVDMLRKALSSMKQEQYDFSAFKDIAVEQAERLVMKVAMGEPLPELKKEAKELRENEDINEIEKMVAGL